MQTSNLNVNRLLVLLLVATLAITTFPSCKKDKSGCTDPLAENYDNDADNDNGTCTYAREKFLGTYTSNENCDSGNWSWSMTVTESSANVQSIVLGNLGDYGENIRATVTGASLTINDTQGGITFSGTGNISGTTLTIIYTASAGGLTDDCTATCIKQ